MKNKSDWDPQHYLKFKNERTQPSIDLVGRIEPAIAPRCIIDVGCGPGNSGQILIERWPHAEFTGLDNSPAMIEKAKADHPAQNWVLADATTYAPGRKFDLIFSNAAIQWIPDHTRLFKTLFGWLSAGGTIAVQTPRFQNMAIGKIIEHITGKGRWNKALGGCSDLFTYHNPNFYYDLLAGEVRRIDLWETDYFHILGSHLAVIEWIRGTALMPYLDRLADKADRQALEDEILEEVKNQYPAQKDGKVLFPFKRLFFIGYK
ncbi:MAG TPA: methyltransferase domain-containing protein [Candidatus Omnitrophota bacterium]|nr:methyltransferase domain-containing protein [Candidatus Omnitrophota bacterium]